MTATTETSTTADDLEALRLPELRALFESATGEPARSPNKKYLARRIREARAAAQDADTAATGEGAQVMASAEDHAAAPDAATAPDDATANANANDEVVAQPATANANDEEIARRYIAGELKPRALTIPQLRAAYRLAVGRDSQSVDRRYLQWRTREALKGNGPVGPLPRRAGADVEHKVLPLRMPAPVVEAMDAAAKRLGYATRIAFLRAAVVALLRAEGEGEAADIIAVG